MRYLMLGFLIVAFEVLLCCTIIGIPICMLLIRKSVVFGMPFMYTEMLWRLSEKQMHE